MILLALFLSKTFAQATTSNAVINDPESGIILLLLVINTTNCISLVTSKQIANSDQMIFLAEKH